MAEAADLAQAAAVLPPTEPAPMPVAPVTLPKLGDFPVAGTDAAKDQWLRLADLYVREAQRATSWAAGTAGAAATNALAAANAGLAQQAAANVEAITPVVEQLLAQWTEHDAAIDRLVSALGGLQFPAGSGGGGIPVSDFVAILTALLKSLGPK